MPNRETGNPRSDPPEIHSPFHRSPLSPSSRRLSTEVYSFVSYVASHVAFAAWLAWVFVPDGALQSWGITYYPDRYWAVAAPTYLLATLFFVAYAYVALNMMAVCPLDSPDMIRDGSTPVTSDLFGPPGEIPDIKDIDRAAINGYLFPEDLRKRRAAS